MQLTSGFAESEHWKGKPQGYAGAKMSLHDAAQSWISSDGYESARASIAAGSPDAVATTLLAELGGGGPAPTLYRGMHDVPESALTKFQPGKDVDIGLSAWSASYSQGAAFTTDQFGGGGRGSVLFRVQPGAKSVDISAAGGGSQEHATGGRYHVVSRSVSTASRAVMGVDPGTTIVTLRQTAAMGG